jgi:acetyltransferase-like isoleucine patch superfamily enzyme
MPDFERTIFVAEITELGEKHQIGPFCQLGYPPESQAQLSKSSSAEIPFSPLTIGDYALIRSHTVIYSSTQIGDYFQTGHHVLIREDCRIGDHVSIGSSSVVEHHVIIRDGVRVHSKVFIPEFTILDTDAWIGPGVIFTNAIFPKSEGVKERLTGPIIGKGAKIGAGAVILPGVSVGEGALIGAGAVVTKDVAAFSVVKGNPARMSKLVKELHHRDGMQAYPEMLERSDPEVDDPNATDPNETEPD